jgi:hypothetical protein
LSKERNAVLLPATLVSCINPDLLENRGCLEGIDGCNDVEKVTDDNLEAWMKKSIGEVTRLITTDDIASMVLRKIRTNMQEKGSSMRINQLVSDYFKLIRGQG